MCKFVQPVLPDGFRFKITHLHPGNSSRKKRRNSPYLTIARVVDAEHNVVAEAIAKCNSEMDVPSRQKGREIATGRVYRQFCDDVV